MSELTKEQIEAIDALAQKATKGPWMVDGHTCDFVEDMDNLKFIASIRNAWPRLRDLALEALRAREWWISVNDRLPYEDAERFIYLQSIPREKAQAFFWNHSSRTERRKAIDKARNEAMLAAKPEQDSK